MGLFVRDIDNIINGVLNSRPWMGKSQFRLMQECTSPKNQRFSSTCPFTMTARKIRTTFVFFQYLPLNL